MLCAFSQIAKSQDLTITGSVTVIAPNPVHVGETINVKFSVQNIGASASTNSFTGIYISPTPNPAAGFLLSRVTLESLSPNASSNNIEYYFPIPYSLGITSSFYVIVSLNDDGGATETNYSNNISNTNINIDSTPWAAQNIPYPVIFIHGLMGANTTWDDFINYVKNTYGWSYGGNMDFCLNYDTVLSNSDIASNYHDFTGEPGHTLNPNPSDFYTVNFRNNPNGIAPYDNVYESNQAAITRQGYAIRDAIAHVLQITGRDKVILVGHSMGGLAARAYLQDVNLFQASDNKKHVAKLATVGTPHGGANMTASPLGTIFPGFSGSSEAIRDLRTGYFYSYYFPFDAPNPDDDAPGTFLFGGVEDLDYMRDQFCCSFHNADVNCDGSATGQPVVGINYKSIPTDINYSCLIGTGQALPINGDGVVTEYSADINNQLPVNADSYMMPYTSGAIWHLELTKQFADIIKGIDEPNSYNNSRAYQISSGQLYYGHITYQPVTAPPRDYDNFKINLPSTGILSIEVFNIPTSIFSINIFNSSGTNVYTLNSNGKSYLNIGANLSSGNYFVVLSGIPTVDSWKYPYSFKCTYTPSSTYCSGTTNLTSNLGSFNDGSGASNYSNNSDCKWLIQPSGATTITLGFSTFNLNNAGDTVYVYDGSTIASPVLAKFTGTSLPTNTTSTAGKLLVRFVTDTANTAAGWAANYTSTLVPTFCNGSNVLTTATGNFSDGSDTSNYANYSQCTWLINPSNAYSITLNFTSFNTESANDVVNVYDGIDNSYPLLGSFSGNSIPSAISSIGGSMFVEFITNNAITSNGWNASYTSFMPNSSNGITEFQYWYDNDYASAVTFPVVSQTNLNLITSLPTNSLPYGLHTLHIRFKDDSNVWSSVLSKFFYKPKNLPIGANKITSYQYWIDNDFATHVDSLINPSQINYTISSSISTVSLADGLHTLHIRFQDDIGSWSAVLSKYFFKATLSPTGLYRMINYRYWYDNNTAAMVNKAFATPLTTQNLYDTLSTPSLSVGNHVIHLQFQDELSQWSSVLTDTFAVTNCQINPAPVITGTDTICSGIFSLLNAGSGYTAYLWSTSATTQTISATSNGIYTVSVTNASGCTGIASFDLTVKSSPAPAITGNDSICTGATSILDAGSGFVSYLWSTADTTRTISANANTTYTVTVTAVNGCSGTDSFVLTLNNLPNPIILGNDSICIGDSTTLDAGSGYTNYLWSTSDTSQTVNINTAGSYTVTVTDSNGCSGFASSTIIINPLPTPTVSGNSAICQNDSTTLDAGSGYTNYLWSTSDTTQTINVNTTGTFTVTVTDGNGCAGTDNFILTVNNLPSPIIMGIDTICIGDSTTLDVGSGYTNYLWSTTATSQTITTALAGTFSVVVTDVNGCSNSTSLIVIINSADTSVTVNGFTLTANASNATYQYIYCDSVAITGETNQVFIATQNGSYSVIVSQNGCTDTSSCFIIVGVGVSQINGASNISIYPNPTNGLLNVNVNGLSSEKCKIILTNTLGQVLNEIEFKATNNSIETQIDMNGLSNGIYFLAVSSNKIKQIFKVQKL